MTNRQEARNDERRGSSQRTSRGQVGGPHKASPAAVERYIRGIHLPANKEDLINQAKQNGAPQGVMYVLKNFEDTHYGTVWEIARETGRVDRGASGRKGRGRSRDDDEDEEEEVEDEDENQDR